MNLTKIANELNRLHSLHGRVIEDGLKQARKIGDLLLQAKAAVKYGKFMAWVEAHCAFDHSSAIRYMLVAKNWDRVAKANNFSSAVRKCRGPRQQLAQSTVPSLRQMAEAGTVKDVVDACLEIIEHCSDPALAADLLTKELALRKNSRRFAEVMA